MDNRPSSSTTVNIIDKQNINYQLTLNDNNNVHIGNNIVASVDDNQGKGNHDNGESTQSSQSQTKNQNKRSAATKEPKPTPKPPDPTFDEITKAVQLPQEMIKKGNNVHHGKAYYAYFRYLDVTQRQKMKNGLNADSLTNENITRFNNMLTKIYEDIAETGKKFFVENSIRMLNEYCVDGIPPIRDWDADLQSFLTSVHKKYKSSDPLYALRMTYKCVHGQPGAGVGFTKYTLLNEINNKGIDSEMKYCFTLNKNDIDGRKDTQDILRIAQSRFNNLKGKVESIEDKVTGLSIRTRNRSNTKKEASCYMIKFKSVGSNTAVYLRVPISLFGHTNMCETPTEQDLLNILTPTDAVRAELRRCIHLCKQKNIEREDVEGVLDSVYMKETDEKNAKVTPETKIDTKQNPDHQLHEVSHVQATSPKHQPTGNGVGPIQASLPKQIEVNKVGPVKEASLPKQSPVKSPVQASAQYQQTRTSAPSTSPSGEVQTPDQSDASLHLPSTFDMHIKENVAATRSPASDFSEIGSRSFMSNESQHQTSGNDESQHQTSGNDDFNKLFDDKRGESETKEGLPCDDDDDKHKKDEDDEEVGKVDNDGRSHGLRGRGEEVFEFHAILAMRKNKTSSEYYVHWKEEHPGQHGDQLMTWVKAKDLPPHFVDEFKETWKPMSKGVSTISL